MNAIPATSTGFTPTRFTSCAATPDQRIAVPATARYPMPVRMGEYPSTCCMYSVSTRNIAKSAVPRISPATFAPATVRRRQIENGISGSAVRDSHRRKEPSSAAEAVKSPIVSIEPQP